MDVFHLLRTQHHTFDLKAWIETQCMITHTVGCISLFYLSALIRTWMWLVDVPLAQNDQTFKVSKHYCLRLKRVKRFWFFCNVLIRLTSVTPKKECQYKCSTEAGSVFEGELLQWLSLSELSAIPNPDEIHYVNQCFFTRINSSTEANMKDVYDFLLLVDMTYSINKG